MSDEKQFIITVKSNNYQVTVNDLISLFNPLFETGKANQIRLKELLFNTDVLLEK